MIGAEIPRPRAARRRFEREAEPLFLLPQRRFGAGAFDGVPGPFGDVANELDLRGRPDARRDVIGAERRDHLSVLEQRHADERRDLPRPERRPVVVAEPRSVSHVVDDDGLAAPERLAHSTLRG